MVIIDLDGTLVRGNTFRMFMRYLLQHSVRHRHFGTTAKLAVLSALRVGRLITHRRLKWNILRLGDKVLTEDDIASFVAEIPARFNPRVRELVEPQKVVLATAAPVEYVAPLAKSLGVEFVATKRPETGRYRGFVECRGTEKLRQVQKKWGTGHDVVTDHADDLALLAAMTGRRILISPSASTLATVRLAGITVEVWT